MKQINTKQKISEYFFLNPNAKLRVREIERKLNLSLPSVIRYTRDLKKEKILDQEKIGSVVFYKADRTSTDYILEKKIYNLRQIYKSGIIDYLKITLNNPGIILFGSYVKGEDIETSDIDLYLETFSKKAFDLKKFESLLHRKIQIFKHQNLKEVSNPHLANNIINGVVINNHIEVFR